MASVFWSIFILSPLFNQALREIGTSPLAYNQIERFIVCNGSGSNASYNLIVFDPQYNRYERNQLTINELILNNYNSLNLTLDLWYRRSIENLQYLMQNYGGLEPSSYFNLQFLFEILMLVRRNPNYLREVASAQSFGILVARPPIIETTAIPNPPLDVAPILGSKPSSTVGTIAKDSNGDIGVTVALHDLQKTLPKLIVGQTKISVAGVQGIVKSIDLITDSAFVTISDSSLNKIPQSNGFKGPLSGVSPRMNEKAIFEGISSGKKTVTVTGWSPDLPFAYPFNQLKILTTPETDQGDSGAALIDNDDHILGFSFYRTGLGEPIEFSAWIWADSVFAAHKLHII
jgi:hypothetical protein